MIGSKRGEAARREALAAAAMLARRQHVSDVFSRYRDGARSAVMGGLFVLALSGMVLILPFAVEVLVSTLPRGGNPVEEMQWFPAIQTIARVVFVGGIAAVGGGAVVWVISSVAAIAASPDGTTRPR